MKPFRPVRFISQFADPKTGASDCGVVTTIFAIDYASGGHIRPTPAEIRKRMGIPSGPTKLSDQAAAMATYAKEAKKLGLRPLTMEKLLARPWKEVREAIATGDWVNVQLDYAVVDTAIPALSGQKGYEGHHSVSVHGVRERDGRTEVRVFDPLANGRFPDIPRGPQWWPLAVVRDAAMSFAAEAGPGLASAGVVKRSEPLEGPGVVPADVGGTPTAKLREQLEAAEDRIDELEDLIGVLRTALATSSDLVQEIDAAVPPPVDVGNAVDGAAPD